MMKRRSFIAASALLGVTSVAGFLFATSKSEEAIAKVLHKKLGYLTLDRAGVEQFSKDFLARKSISSLKLRAVDGMGVLYSWISPSADNKLIRAIQRGEDRIVTEFLISSDFFLNQADESRVVRYLGPFDPLSACRNPFARLV